MFLIILKILASNVLKLMFLLFNIICSTGCAVVIFHPYKPTGSTNQLEAKIYFIELTYSLPWLTRMRHKSK